MWDLPPKTVQEFQGPIFMIDSLPVRLDGFMLGPTGDQMALKWWDWNHT